MPEYGGSVLVGDPIGWSPGELVGGGSVIGSYGVMWRGPEVRREGRLKGENDGSSHCGWGWSVNGGGIGKDEVSCANVDSGRIGGRRG